jgi:hypothetical protein
VCALVAAAILGLSDPHTLAGGGAWGLVVLAVLYGYGAGIRRFMRIDVLVGEQLALGTIAWLFLAGVLLSAGIASRVPLLVLAGIGFALTLVELAQRRQFPRLRRSTRDEHWVITGLAFALGVFLLFNLLAKVGTRGNPYDDHVAYTAFVKRMLDVGDLVEPFSFRRLSAYGGQTALLALAALRGDVQSTDLLDGGVFQIVAVLLVIDTIRRRQLHVTITVVIVVLLLCLWDLSINSAATWTGFACFMAAYAFATRDDLAPRTSLVLTFAACAAACTLRQNYLLPAGLFALLLLASHVRAGAAKSSWRDAWLEERGTAALAVGVSALIVLPYAVAAWQSNRTFLYPILLGTWNPTAPLRPTGGTVFDEVAFFAGVLLKPDSLRIWWLLLPLMFLARDVRARRPWRALVIANCAGFAFLIHSFMLSDSNTLWRYGFGYMTAMAIAFMIEVAGALPTFGDRSSESALQLPRVAVVLVWLGVAAQAILARDVPASKLVHSVENVKAGLTLGSGIVDDRVVGYADMQATIPPGARVAILLDDAYLLDYRRNRIFNLDLPGFSAPRAGLPSFTSPRHWRAYFNSLGIRYVAFVAKEYSSYLFRRPGWLWRMYADDELWRFMAAHMVDTLDTLHALADSGRVLYHDHGLYAVDLGEADEPEPDRGPDELTRMDAFIRHISEHELGSNAWQLASRRNVVFQTDSLGPSAIVPMPSGSDTTSIFERLLGDGRARVPHRWLMDRNHVRVRGERKQRLHVKLWVNKRRLFTTPTLSLILDGKTLVRSVPNADGMVTMDAVTSCTGWCDLYLVSSTISEFWRLPDDLKGLKLLEFDWAEVQ